MSPLLKRKNGTINDKYLLRQYCAFSALAAFGIMMVIYLFHGNTLWGGDHTVLRMDLYHQYGPLYAEVYDRLTSGGSMIYSWTSGLGGSFLGNLFNYCSSPFALVLLILGHKNMPEAIAVMIMLKAMFAASSFTYFINKSNREVRKESILFGLFYAFSGYFVAYSWNIMWFDAIAVFPLVMLGIERIIQHNKPALYIVTLTYTMITNYYMAYMVCILSVMYFLYFFFGRYELSSLINRKKENEETAENISSDSVDSIKESELSELSQSETDFVDFAENKEFVTESLTETICENETVAESKQEIIAASIYEEKITNTENSGNTKKSIKKKSPGLGQNRFWVTGWSFALSSFLCFAIAAFALIPVYFCLQSSSATADTFPENPHQYFDIFTFITNHFPGIEPTIRSSGDNVIPNVYCGLLSVILLPFYFFSSKIPGKQKVVSAILLIACMIGFALNYFNFIWHGLHMPNDLPYRWSFAYSFFLLFIAYKAFKNISEFSTKAYIGVGFAILAFIVLVEKIKIPNADQLTIILSATFTILYIVIFGMMRSPKYRQGAVVGLLFFTVILEIVAADAPKMVMQQSKKAYTSDYEAFVEIQEKTESDDAEPFFRTELAKLRTRMDASWYGYNGVSIFSSMAYEKTAKIMKDLGMFGNNINSYTYYPQTPIFNSLFSIKYIYDNMNFINDSDYYTEQQSNADFTSHKYDYYLPLISVVDDDVKNWLHDSNDPFEVQNNLMSDATGVNDILIPVDATAFEGDNIDNVSVSSINSSTMFSVSKSANGSEGKAIVKITPDAEGHYYIYAGSTQLSSLNIEAGEFAYNYVSSSIQPYIVDVGKLTTEDEITVTYTIPADTNTAKLTFVAARADMERFEEAYNIIKNNGSFTMDSFDETSFSGKLNVISGDSMLWTSIPYDESWKVYLDGELLTYEKVDADTGEIIAEGDIFRVGDGLLGIKAEKGEHTIEFKYSAKGLSTGIKLTIVGILSLMIVIVFKKYLLPLIPAEKFTPAFLRKPDYYND